MGSRVEEQTVAKDAPAKEMTVGLKTLSNRENSTTCQKTRKSDWGQIRAMGYNCQVPLVKPLLILSRRKKPLNWDTEKKDGTIVQWSKIIFSNESKLCLSFGIENTVYGVLSKGPPDPKKSEFP